MDKKLTPNKVTRFSDPWYLLMAMRCDYVRVEGISLKRKGKLYIPIWLWRIYDGYLYRNKKGYAEKMQSLLREIEGEMILSQLLNSRINQHQS